MPRLVAVACARYQAVPWPCALRVTAGTPGTGPSTYDATASAPARCRCSDHTSPTDPSSSLHPFPLPQRGELLDADAEQLTEGTGIAAQPDVVVLVDDAAEVGHQRRRPAGDGRLEARGGGVGDDVERRHQDQPVAGQVAVGVHDVDPHAVVEHRAVQGVRHVQVAHVLAGVGVQLAGPPGLPVEQDGHVVVGLAAGDLLGSGRAWLPSWTTSRQTRLSVPACGTSAGSGTSRRRPGRPATGRTEPVGAVGEVLHAVARQLAGPLGDVARLPVHRRWSTAPSATRAGHRQRPAPGRR